MFGFLVDSDELNIIYFFMQYNLKLIVRQILKYFGGVLKVRPVKFEEYKKLHENVLQDILKMC